MPAVPRLPDAMQRLRTAGARIAEVHARVGRDLLEHVGYLHRRYQLRRANRFQRHPILDSIADLLFASPGLPSTKDAAPHPPMHDRASGRPARGRGQGERRARA